MIKPILTSALLAASLHCGSLLQASVVVAPQLDFMTTAWSFGAPYIRDSAELGISNINPFGMGASSWEETTYLTFDFASLNLTAPVQSAVLTVTTVARSGFPAGDLDGTIISAHYLSSSPTLINPALSASGTPAAGEFSYTGFKLTELGAVVDEFTHGAAFGTYTLDLTDLVNDWILNGNTNHAYATALTARNAANDADAWLAITNGGSFLTITTVPEPGRALLLCAGVVLCLGRRSRKRHTNSTPPATLS